MYLQLLMTVCDELPAWLEVLNSVGKKPDYDNF